MNKNILICEDEEGIVEVTKIVLEEKGYNVIAVPDNTQIFDIVEKVKPNLILLDLWMPGLSGEEIARKLKNDPETKEIPIIIVSANRYTKNIAEDVGADNFLEKPFDIDALEKIVQQYIN